MANLKCIVAKFAISVIIAICQDAPFFISFVNFFKIFVKPLITSWKNCHFPKNRQLSKCHFLSSHLNIWPNPYRLNLPLSYNYYLCKMPVFVVTLKFCQTFEGFYQKFVDFAKKWHFRKNPQLMTSFLCHLVSIFAKNASFVVSLKIFARPLINPNSPISQNLSFSLNPQLSTCLFCHLVLIFAKPINSCQIGHFPQSCYCR